MVLVFIFLVNTQDLIISFFSPYLKNLILKHFSISLVVVTKHSGKSLILQLHK